MSEFLWCHCGHTYNAHRSKVAFIDNTGKTYDKFGCFGGVDCGCRMFREDGTLWGKFKRKINAR